MRAWYLLALPIAQAVLVNHTIDDEQGDSEIQFSPSDGWSQGSTCFGCKATQGGVSNNSAFNGTWHDSTHHPGDGGRTVTLSFSGTAVYAFGIMGNDFGPGVTTLTNLSVVLDQLTVGNFVHSPTNSTDIQYNASIFAVQNLENIPHQLVITANSSEAPSLFLFDYAIYT
ncbi:hypothetical protein HETIRDRAFT_326292 [Heterobasidion irregulare TC 32-1]|uniref:Uncharacterized protein n=1 Tax=Heterobasidion irregulare (strain TC 32-1) TaxID=747525 RepID=W4JWA4_HETIT|nr:uncharacterized protein HETIRDRAFT_326292 [Heterobasidion irregulare TC 32-1]ETW77817.1 hypothetical protein HETIRDRAFT_326292 [Heterobasidion irregulare TC 32-1]